MSYLVSDYPSYTNGIFSNLNNNYGYLLFTSNSSITFQKNTNCDILIIGAGGRGGLGYYSGGGGAGEVIYYPSYTFTSNFYNIQIGIDSSFTSNRISKITSGANEIIKALGGGDGGYNIIRQYPPKLYNSVSTEISTTLNSISCFRQDITLDTTDITDGSGIYEIYYSTRYNNSGITYGGYKAFNYITNANTGEFASINGGYRTTTPFDYIGTKYLVESTYKGEFLCIKMPVPIVITSYSIYPIINSTIRAPKNFRLYASNDGINWITLQTITNAVYDATSFIYTNTNFSTNITPYLYYAIVINQVFGYNLINITHFNEWIINGYEPIKTLILPTSGGSGGGGCGYYNISTNYRYIPKAPTSQTIAINRNLNAIACYGKTLTLDNTGITYGSGTYELYYSSYAFGYYTINDVNTPYQIFNFDNNSNSSGGHFQYSIYNTSTGVYNGTNYLVDSNYKGEWIVIKFPSEIIINKYIITARFGYINRAPKKYRVYGSIDGISWTIIDDVNISTESQYISCKYQNIIPNNIPFSYYCLTINEIFPSNDSGVLNFIEIEYYNVINNYQGSSSGSPYNVNYSLLTYGNNGTSIQGGNGGSANIISKVIKKPNSSIILYDNIQYSYSINYQTNQTINQGSFKSLFNNGSIELSNVSYTTPWGAYFADDWSGTTLLDSSGNGRHATTSGTITKTTLNGNGATGNISFISGGTTATISWPTGSIPTNFTIVSLTRFNGINKYRILASAQGNWAHGHGGGLRGVAFYEAWKTNQISIGNVDDWVCCIGKNSGTIPNNILIDGVPSGIETLGTGGYTLVINLSSFTPSDWALSALFIYDSHLSDDNIIKLNNYINNYKTSGNISELKLNIIKNIDKSYPILKEISLTNEREYPSKSFDSFITQQINSSGELFNINPTTYIKETIILNTNNIYYGSGDYNIYSSSYTTDNNGRPKSLLFNKITTDLNPDNFGGWNFNYDISNGYYLTSRTSYIKSNYTGEWLIIELPIPIILSKYQLFYHTISSAPSLWRFYGSNDGIDWIEIIQAYNDINPLTSNDYLNGYYEKNLSSSFNISYKYLGITFKKIVGNDTTLILREFKIFGKEEKNINNINPAVWYKFDDPNDIGKDEMGVANMTNNNSVITNAGIKGDYCSVFNGTSQYLSTTTFPSLNNISFSICFWCVYLNTTGQASFFGLNNSLNNGNDNFFIKFDNNFTIRFRLIGINDLIYTSPTSFLNQIIFLCFTFDGSNGYKKIMYLNGKEVLSNNDTRYFNPTTNSTYYSIGRYMHNVGEYGKVKLDDFRVYTNIVLTSNQVQELYYGRIELSYKFKEGLTLQDLTIGTGGTGATSNSTPVIKNNYGDGGDGNGGFGYQGAVIIRFPFENNIGNSFFSPNLINITDNNYSNLTYYNDIKQKPSFCNICFTSNYDDIITNKPNLNSLSTLSNLFYTSNILNSYSSNINFNTSNNLITYNNNKFNNLSSSIWNSYGSNIYNNSGSVGIGTSVFGNNKLSVKGNFKADDFKIKGNSISNIFITSNTFDIKSNNIYNNISNLDFNSKQNQKSSSQFITDASNNIFINYYSNYSQYSNLITSSCNSLIIPQTSQLIVNYSNIYNINQGTYNIAFSNGSINFNSITDKSYPILKDINPIVWYKFDDNFLNDTFASSNNLINNGATYDTTNFVKGNGSINFNTTLSQYATIPNNFNWNAINALNGISFSWWAKINSNPPSWIRMFEFGNKTSDTNGGSRFIMVSRNGLTNNLIFQITNPTEFNYSYTGTNYEFLTTTENFFNGTWKHYVWTISPSGIWNIYINNSKIANNIQKMAIPVMSGTIFNYLGKSLYNTTACFNGNLDDFRIYDFVLSPNQVQELYNIYTTLINYQTNYFSSYSSNFNNPFIRTSNNDLELLSYTNNNKNSILLQSNINLFTNDNNQLILNSDIISINKSLDIKGNSGTLINRGGAYFRITNGTTFYGTYFINSINFSLRTTDNIICGKNSYALSDNRIKKNIIDINDESSLEKILKIEPKIYKYIDNIRRTNSNVYGFIAQQVRDVLPEATELTTKFIPDIFKLVKKNGNMINLNEEELKKIIIGDVLEIYTKDNSYEVNVINKDNDGIEIDRNIEENDIFIFGRQVKDFHILDKSYLYTLNICATQELARIVEGLKEKINNL